MRKMTYIILCVAFFWIPSEVFSVPLEWHFFDNVDVFLKGELTYTARVRTDKQDDPAVDASSGNTNFERGDFTNNKISTRLEFKTTASNYTFFASGELFYDWVYTDKDLFNEEIRDHAQKNAEFLDLYVEANFNKVVCRLGRQIVQWGESIAPAHAVGVNTVSPYNAIKSTTAGYTLRDYQLQSPMAWISITPILSLSIEGVYNPEFEPRYMLPTVGTIGSPIDILGFGAVNSYEGIPIIDDRPEDFEDKQQYGCAVRKTFPNLKNLEVGLYYYHHLNRTPVMTFSGIEVGLTDPSLVNVTYTYPEQDMYGFSFSTVIDWFDLGTQFGGEFALRPNAPMQLNYYLTAVDALALPMAEGESLGALGGYEETRMLYWDFTFIHSLDYNMPLFGWVITSSPIVEIYGQVNTEYEENKFAEPEDKTYFTIILDFTTYEMVDNWKTSLSFTYNDTLYDERYSDFSSLKAGIDLKRGDNLSFLLAYNWRVSDPDEYSETLTANRNVFTFQTTFYF